MLLYIILPFCRLSGTFHWSPEDKGEHISIEHQSRILYVGTDDGPMIIRTTQSVPETSASFYFEARVLDSGTNGEIAIGLTQADPGTRSESLPGCSDYSSLGIVYHGDDGGIYHDIKSVAENTEPYTTGDVVGCFMCRNCIEDEEVILVQ